ncbi:hypothetical protein [Rhizobium mayense]|uniref:Uncharacterized protein n=1 Tax=Rhizobium mayense TaxID=1312184 RepID=A0ABT7JRL4_9HYPH|nr:hypothetical protein [Rhizobium mayense]MDL2398998.1 hypothetical protein [Rhizobium mayense]
MDKRSYVGMTVDVKPHFGFVPAVISNEDSTNQSAVILTCRRLAIAI